MNEALKELRNHPFATRLLHFRPDRASLDPETHLRLARDFVDACTCDLLETDEAVDLRSVFVVAALDVVGRDGDRSSDEPRVARFLACANRPALAAAYGGLLSMGAITHLEAAVKLAEASEPAEYDTLPEPAWHVRMFLWRGLWWMGRSFEPHRQSACRAFAYLAVVAEQAGDESARQRWVDGFHQVSSPSSRRRGNDLAMTEEIRACARDHVARTTPSG